MPSGRKKCICQLCTCGRHLCPHRKKEQLVLGNDQQSAKSISIAVREEKKKQRKQWDIQEISSSTEKVNDVSVLVDSTNLATAITVENKGNKAAAGNRNWSSKQIPRTLPIKRPDTLRQEGDSDFTTVHQQDFKAKQLESIAIESVSKSSKITQAESWNKKQIPKTQKIKNPDTLIFSGPSTSETTHQADYNESTLRDKVSRTDTSQQDSFQRPRTSLKLSGEFQSDSSYQRAFTEKRPDDGFKVKKGTSKSHLRPEGEMTFDTTSTDYNAYSSRASEKPGDLTVLKPKAARPESEIKIPSVPLSDETTIVSDFKKWNVEKPRRHKPSDTLQLGDPHEADTTLADVSTYSRTNASKSESSNWQVTRPVVRKPQNNLKPEGDFQFATTNDIDYSSRRDTVSNRHSILEPLTERTETESIEASIPPDDPPPLHATEQAADKSEIHAEHSTEQNGAKELHQDSTVQTDVSANGGVPDQGVPDQEVPDSSYQTEQKISDDNERGPPNEEQTRYVSWDEIRPKPIRPHSNLRQEGGMDFNTTNRSEFVSRPTERVKGIRPKTSTKLFEGDFDSTTMNQVMFSHDQGERVIPIRPKSNLHVETGDFNDETTSAREFQPWKVKRPPPIIPKSNLAQEGTIDFTTTSNVEFEEKRSDKVEVIRPITTNRISGDIDLTTTNSVMHAEFPIERVKKIVPQSNLRMSSGAFISETTNQVQFQDWGIDRPKPIRPVPNLTQEGSMDFKTMNQMQFEGKQGEKVDQFRPHTSSKMTGEFEGVTTNQAMFPTQPLQRPHMVMPKGNLQVEKGKFATDTTNHSEFQQWQQSKQCAVTPRNNLHQEGNVDYTTTSQQQYGSKVIDRVSQIRPKTNSKITGDFDGTTTNQVMFQDSPRAKLQAIRPHNNIEIEKGDFKSETTTNEEYKQWEYSKPSLIKPHSTMKQEGDIDFTTTNDREYAGKTTERVSQIRPTTTTKITGEFEGTTMNQMMFQTNAIETIRGKRPPTNIHLDKGKFEDQTTSQREFQQWDSKRPDPIKPSGNLSQEGKMDFTTSNQTDFQEKTIEMVEPIRPHTSSPLTGDFDGTTTNQVMFQGQHSDRVHNIRPTDNLRVDSGQFDTETTASKAYAYKAGTKPEAIRPKSNLTQEGEFDFVTSNQMQFEEKPLSKVTQTRPKTQTKASDGKFYSITSNQAMFEAPVAETVREIRPSDNLHVEGGKFEDKTTSSDEYQQWKVQKPSAFQLASSLKQEGGMEFETTSHSEFKERGFDRAKPIRPKTTNKTEGDFEGTTTNQVMFQGHEKLERVKPIRHENNLGLETGKFSHETTNSREFRQWVKMENHDSTTKRGSQPAGVRSLKEKTNKKGQASRGKSDHSSEKDAYKPWKLNDESIQSENNVTRTLESGELNKNVDVTQTSVQTSGKHPEGPSQKEMHVHPSQRTEGDNGIVHESRDVSAEIADYGAKQTSKVRAIVGSGSLTEDRGNDASTLPERATAQQGDTKHAEQSDYANAHQRTDEHDNSEYKSWKIQENERTSMSETSRRRNGEIGHSKGIDVGDSNEALSSKKTIVLRPLKRFKPDDNLKIESVPFNGTSTTRTEYKKWESRRSSSKKRDESLKQEGDMEFHTTSSDYSLTKTYNKSRQETKAKSKADQRGSLGYSGSMDFHTTSTTDYAGSVGSKSKNLRPRSSLKLGTDERTSYDTMSSSRSNPESTREYQNLTSTSRASYVGHAVGSTHRSRAHRPTTSQKVGGSFEGQTTSRTSFTAPQEQATKSRAVKHESHNILNALNGFSGDTTYTKSFEATKGHQCPVIDLQAGRSSLTFNEERNGHIYYAPRLPG